MWRAGNSFSSKRAKTLVALCGNEPSPTSSEVSAISSCFTLSPVPSWFDGIFEASDMAVAHNNPPSRKSVNSAKRKLYFSSTAELKFNPPTLHQEETRKASECTPSPTSTDVNQQLDVAAAPSMSPDVHGVSEKNCVEVRILHQDTGMHKEEVCGLQLYPSQKKILAAKVALNAGQEHITSGGKMKKGRSLKPPCKEICKRCAKPKLSINERLEIHKEFWALKDHVKQWTFINESVTCNKPKRKTCAPGTKGAKLSSRVYHFTVSGIPKIVCKTMFKSTLSICDSWIDSAVSHFLNGEMTCDKRGRK